jgi:dienelactone hydrolase
MCMIETNGDPLPEPLAIKDPSWKQRFRAPVISWTQIAPADPSRGLVASNATGQMQLYAWCVRTGKLTQLTNRPTGISDGYLAGDGRHVYFLDDAQGSEIGRFVRVPFEGGAPQNLSPNMPVYLSWFFATSGSGTRFGFTASDASGFHIYERETFTSGSSGASGASGALGELRQLFHSRKFAYGPSYSFSGDVALIASTDRAASKHYSLLAFDTKTGAQIAELWDGAGTSIEAVKFSPRHGDMRMLGTSHRIEGKRPLIWNPSTNERTDLLLAQLEGDVIPVDWSADGASVLVCQIAQAVQQLYLYRLGAQTLTKLIHPPGSFNLPGTYFEPGGAIYAQWQDAAHPPCLIELDGSTGAKKRTVLTGGKAPPGRPWKSISFSSSDGQVIQGWLGVPEGAGPFPTILHTHGGPESVMTEIFAPMSQAWMDHGFAYMSINYRGSTTFGREFQEKIWGDVGHWEIEDLVAARLWLVNQGVAKPDAVLLTGWSYGGFITLMGLGKRPDLWAGGMAGTAVADWTMMYEDASAAMKGYLAGLFSGTPEDKPEQYRASSPLTYADRVQAPVLMLQGLHDSRTPVRQVQAYESRLKALGRQIEVCWFAAGHLGAGTNQNIEHFEGMMEFAKKACRPTGPRPLPTSARDMPAS